jgi:hypothetical protein
MVNLKTDLGEIGSDDTNLIDLAGDVNKWRAFVNMVTNLGVRLNILE